MPGNRLQLVDVSAFAHQSGIVVSGTLILLVYGTLERWRSMPSLLCIQVGAGRFVCATDVASCVYVRLVGVCAM